MQTEGKKPEIIVFAGPNGSGKTTVTKLARIVEPYINADDIKRTTHQKNLSGYSRREKQSFFIGKTSFGINLG